MHRAESGQTDTKCVADSLAEAQRAFLLTRVINRRLVKPTGTASVTVSTRDCVFAATTTSNIIKSTVEADQGSLRVYVSVASF